MFCTNERFYSFLYDIQIIKKIDKLSDIFSVDIAGNYNKYPKCFNKYAIKNY